MSNGDKNGNGLVGQVKNNPVFAVTIIVNMIFTVFWVATQAARINSAEMAIEANRLQTVEIRAYVRDFASRVDRQETPLARHVVDLEKNINILDDRIRALSERVTALERK